MHRVGLCVPNAIHSWGDRQPDLDYVAGEAGGFASVASVLARVTTFRRLIFAEKRTWSQTLALLAFIVVPLTLGVLIRIRVPNFLAADISFELSFCWGCCWGRLGHAGRRSACGSRSGSSRVPGAAVQRGAGTGVGLVGTLVGREEIWSFTPFIDLSLYRWVRRNLRQPRIDRQFLMLFLIVAAEACRTWLKHAFPSWIFALMAPQWWLQVMVWLSAPIVVGIALKVWNTLRVELKLEDRSGCCLRRGWTHCSGDHPHFLSTR